jgi:hypothetical protein
LAPAVPGLPESEPSPAADESVGLSGLLAQAASSRAITSATRQLPENRVKLFFTAVLLQLPQVTLPWNTREYSVGVPGSQAKMTWPAIARQHFQECPDGVFLDRWCSGMYGTLAREAAEVAMARTKISTTVYITQEQSEKLKLLSQKTKVPVSEYIREGIDLALEKHRTSLPGQISFVDQK